MENKSNESRRQRLLFLKKVYEQHREYVEDELKKCGNDPERLATMLKIKDIVKINSAWTDEELGKLSNAKFIKINF